jgi:ABC-type phosphate transport system auxiliary subunit
MKKIEIKPNEITINEEGDLKIGDMILKEEEQIPLMKHLYSMEKQRKKYQAKIDDLQYELEKVERSKLKKEIKKLQEELKNEKAEKEVFKIEAKAYKEENAQLKKRIGE